MHALLRLGLITLAVQGALADETYVALGDNGKLVYRADTQGNRIPDFSNCGYRGGGVALPSIEVKKTISPIEGDCTALVQAAIEEVSRLPRDAAGHRGAVLLKKGTYRLENPIRIMAGGVVLRGEGQDENGTVLLATAKQAYDLIHVGTENSGPTEVADTRRKIAGDYVPVGTRRFDVRDASPFHVGDRVIVFRPSTENWIHDIGMDRIPPREGTVQWTAGSKDLRFDRVVTAVDGNTIEVDAPICNALEARYGGGFIYRYEFPERISEVGIENLRGDSVFSHPMDEKHGWRFIAVGSAENAWVRDVTSIHYGYSCAVTGWTSKWITIQDSACLDPVSWITGGRRYSFMLGGQLSLVQRCRAREGRHDFVFAATVPGPNVFLDCTAEKAYADSGPHQRWSVGMLFDNVKVEGNELNMRNRGNSGTGHGWTGANSALWNCSAQGIKCENPPTAQNWSIGSVTKDGKQSACQTQSFGTPVKPQSLYLTQLAERLGPGAITAIQKSNNP